MFEVVEFMGLVVIVVLLFEVYYIEFVMVFGVKKKNKVSRYVVVSLEVLVLLIFVI